MKHYIIVKFKDYDYKKALPEISELFNESLELDGVNDLKIYESNSKRSNRYDIMIEMSVTQKGMDNFDNSELHKRWKEDYGRFILNKAIFDCE